MLHYSLIVSGSYHLYFICSICIQNNSLDSTLDASQDINTAPDTLINGDPGLQHEHIGLLGIYEHLISQECPSSYLDEFPDLVKVGCGGTIATEAIH